MGKILVHEFITLDGVIESPTWTAEYPFEQISDTIGQLTGSSEAILLGRRTFEMFAPAWSTRTAEEDPGAPFFNETPKYVVASKEPGVEWSNSEVIGPYDPQAIRQLKDRLDGDIYVSGSGMLVRGLLADGLLDELHLFVFPLTLGTGDRLFGNQDTPPVKLSLVATDSYESGVVHLAYEPAPART